MLLRVPTQLSAWILRVFLADLACWACCPCIAYPIFEVFEIFGRHLPKDLLAASGQEEFDWFYDLLSAAADGPAAGLVQAFSGHLESGTRANWEGP